MKKMDILLIVFTGVMAFALIIWNFVRVENRNIAKESLNLPYIVKNVDELGNGEIQLNWQEIIAIIAMDSDKDLSEITETDLQEVASEFIDGDRVLAFDCVLEKLELDAKEKGTAYENLNQLKHYSYLPLKTDPESAEMQFIDSIKDGAIESYQAYGILPSVIIAQAILESSWGSSELTKEANNLFGIKRGVSWDGQVMDFKTKEGFDEYIIDTFRKYPSLEASIIDHGLFLNQNERYTHAGVFEAKTYIGQARALEQAGYSTAADENGNKIYADMLGQLIRQYNLQLIDHEVLY